jgi:hypothetical protein
LERRVMSSVTLQNKLSCGSQEVFIRGEEALSNRPCKSSAPRMNIGFLGVFGSPNLSGFVVQGADF